MASFIAEKIREERGDDVYVSVLFGVRRKERGRMVLNGEEEEGKPWQLPRSFVERMVLDTYYYIPISIVHHFLYPFKFFIYFYDELVLHLLL